jgi:beta-glucosidase
VRRGIPALLLTVATVVGAGIGAAPAGASVQPGALAVTSAYSLTQAEAYVAQSGTQTEPCADAGGGLNVSHFAPGDWIAFDLDFGSSSPSSVSTRIASGSVVSGVLRFRLDSPTGTPFATALVFPTGGWQSWVTAPADLHNVATGVHRVYVTPNGAPGIDLVNVNWFQFHR